MKNNEINIKFTISEIVLILDSLEREANHEYKKSYIKKLDKLIKKIDGNLK